MIGVDFYEVIMTYQQLILTVALAAIILAACGVSIWLYREFVNAPLVDENEQVIE